MGQDTSFCLSHCVIVETILYSVTFLPQAGILYYRFLISILALELLSKATPTIRLHPSRIF